MSDLRQAHGRTEDELLADPSIGSLYEWLGQKEDVLFRLARSAGNDFTTMQEYHNQSNTFSEWRRELKRLMVLTSCQGGNVA